MNALSIPVSIAFAAAGIGLIFLIEGIVAHRLRQLEKGCRLRDEFFKHAHRVVQNPASPASIVVQMTFMARSIATRRIVWYLALLWVSGALQRTLAHAKPDPHLAELRKTDHALYADFGRAMLFYVQAVTYADGFVGSFVRAHIVSRFIPRGRPKAEPKDVEQVVSAIEQHLNSKLCAA